MSYSQEQYKLVMCIGSCQPGLWPISVMLVPDSKARIKEQVVPC
jgi:hypothetical protein